MKFLYCYLSSVVITENILVSNSRVSAGILRQGEL